MFTSHQIQKLTVYIIKKSIKHNQRDDLKSHMYRQSSYRTGGKAKNVK